MLEMLLSPKGVLVDKIEDELGDEAAADEAAADEAVDIAPPVDVVKRVVLIEAAGDEAALVDVVKRVVLDEELVLIELLLLEALINVVLPLDKDVLVEFCRLLLVSPRLRLLEEIRT